MRLGRASYLLFLMAGITLALCALVLGGATTWTRVGSWAWQFHSGDGLASLATHIGYICTVIAVILTIPPAVKRIIIRARTGVLRAVERVRRWLRIPSVQHIHDVDGAIAGELGRAAG